MPAPETPELYFPDRPALRAWLARHHAAHRAIWLVYDKAAPGRTRSLDYDAIVEEGLCFGWIDSLPGKVDALRTKVYFAPRKPRSGWSALNKRRIIALTKAGLIEPPGQAKIDAAKRDGSWTTLDAAEALEVPADLTRALRAAPPALSNFSAFPPGARKQVLLWVLGAKRPETRAARVAESARLAALNIRAGDPKARAEARLKFK